MKSDSSLEIGIIHPGIDKIIRFNFTSSHILVEEIYNLLKTQFVSNEDTNHNISLTLENNTENWKILNPNNYLDDYNIPTSNSQPIILRSRYSDVNKLLGGKGGFGSLLKGQAQRAGQKKTTNFSSCRDLNGRRLRTVENERNVEQINQEKKKTEELKRKDKKRKEEMKKKEEEKIKAKINSDLENQTKDLKNALSEGISKRKREDFENEEENTSSSSSQVPPKKRKKLLFDDDEEEDDENSSQDENENENEEEEEEENTVEKNEENENKDEEGEKKEKNEEESEKENDNKSNSEKENDDDEKEENS